MDPGIIASLVFFALLVGFIVLTGIITSGAPKRRTRALEAVAAEMGFFFVADKPNFLEDLHLPGTLLIWTRWARNFMEGTVSGMRTVIFDCYTRSTVVAFASTQRRVPAFDLSRKPLLQPNSTYSNLVELSAPEFSRRFALIGVDHNWLRRMFDRQVIDLIVSSYARRSFRLNGGGPWLVFVAQQRRIKPAKWQGFLQDMSQIASAVFERARAEDTAAA
jgi:hypothetical protein